MYPTMETNITMWIIGLICPAFVSLLVVYLSDKQVYLRQMRKDEISKERAYALIEGDINALKNTTNKMSEVLYKIDDRIDTMGERLTKLEARKS